MQFGGQPTPWSETEIEGARLRSVSQILIQEIGAAGPENAEDSARRACGVIQRMADQTARADARIAELVELLTECRDCVASDINYTLAQFHEPAAVDYLHALLMRVDAAIAIWTSQR